MIEIKIIDAQHKTDINIPNEPFQMFGQIIPTYNEKSGHTSWSAFLPIMSQRCAFQMKTMITIP